MDLMDLTLLGPVNDLLTLTDVAPLGLEHLAGAQLAMVAVDHVVAALPLRRRRRRRRGGFGFLGFLGLLCCLVPVAVVAGVGYLLWKRSQGNGAGPVVPPSPPAPDHGGPTAPPPPPKDL